MGSSSRARETGWSRRTARNRDSRMPNKGNRPTIVDRMRVQFSGLPRRVNHWSDVPCIEYEGARKPDGYGVIRFEGRSMVAHRVAYRLWHGVFAPVHTCHHCDNRGCVQPHHLFSGTAAQNMADAVRKGRTLKGEKAPGHLNRKVDPTRILDMTACGCGRGEIARWLGISQPYATKIANGSFKAICA